jgi:hypothetical protein
MVTLLAALGLLGTAAAGPRTGTLVGIANNAEGLNDAPADTGTLAALDPDAGAWVDRVVVPRSGVAMTWDPRTDLALGILHHEGGAQLLVEIDPLSLEVGEPRGVLVDAQDAAVRHKVTALSLTDDGRLYGVAARRTFVGGLPVPAGYLVEIDPTSGRTWEVGQLGMPVFSRGGTIANSAFLLVSNHDRQDPSLYAWRVDLADGTPEALGPLGIAGRAVGVTRTSEGQVLAALSGEPDGDLPEGGAPSLSHLYVLDPATGELTWRGETGVHNISGLAWVQDLWVRHLVAERPEDNPDHAANDLDFVQGAVAELRIGDRGGRATFEADVGHSTARPHETAQVDWVNGEPVDVTIAYDPEAAAFTLTLGQQTLSTVPALAGRDLLLRARSTRSSARMVLTDLSLDGLPLDADVDSAGPFSDDGRNVLHVHGRWLEEGFTLTGRAILSWDPADVPRQSHLALQVGFGTARAAWK